ncbi:MAG: type I-C CRISPR-associated protein Cas8c/Csd1 [Acetivibrionales bacterium]
MLSDLVRYYEILAAEESSTVPKPGYGTARISYSLNIDDDGNLINITSCKIQEGKKLVARPMTVPEPVTGRTGTKPVPDFLYGNSSYVLGFDNKGKPELTKKRFKSFKDFNIPILKNAGCKEAEAVIKFLEKWDAEKADKHPALLEYIDEIKKGAVLIFRYYGGKEVHNVPAVRKAWEMYKNSNPSGIIKQCMVTGEKTSITMLHPVIKRLYKGQSMGNQLVSYNENAFESYNPTKDKRQGLNAPVGEYAAFAYGTALNTLLSDMSHKIILGETTVVFWAETTVPVYQDMFSLLMDCSEIYGGEENKKFVRSESAEKMVKEMLDRIAQGKQSGCWGFFQEAWQTMTCDFMC